MTLSLEGATVLRGPELRDLPSIDLVTGTVAGPTAPQVDETPPWLRGDTAPEEPSPVEAELQAAIETAYRRGWEEGARTTADAVAGALTALEKATDHLSAAVAADDRAVIDVAVPLALELTRLLLNREIAAAEDPGADAIRRGLEQAPSAGHLVVRLHPDDRTGLDEVGAGLTGRSYEIVADPSVETGDALIDVGGGRIDARIGPALTRVAEVLQR